MIKQIVETFCANDFPDKKKFLAASDNFFSKNEDSEFWYNKNSLYKTFYYPCLILDFR